jgi:hypothetical protein
MRQVWAGRGLPAAAVVALGAILAGCSSSILTTPASSFSGLFASNSTTATGTTAAGAPANFECPSVTIRAGASTLSVSANPTEESALNLRYQVGIGQTARECKLNGTIVTMRVGMQGRVILGPAGVPGQIDLPLRLAVVHEGPEPKTIVTKLNRVPVTIPPGDGNVPFTTIEEDLSFPMPRGGLIDEYVVYVGFDPQSAREPVRRRPDRAPRRPPA